MRHRRKINHLSRKSAHRKAMLANMASSLIIHKRINTTVAKAKALRTYVEPLITKSKLAVTTKTSVEEATHLRRVVFSYLQNKEAVSELFREVSSKIVDRPGGYTRIIKTGARLGDNAEMCMMELVDYNENLLTDKAAAESKSKRRRRGGKKKSDETAVEAAVTAEAVVETEEIIEEAVEDVVAEEVVEAEIETAVEEQVAQEEIIAEVVAEEKTDAPTDTAEDKKENSDDEGTEDDKKKEESK